MAAWKVLLIGMFATVCLALGLATIIVPLDMAGGQRWLWLGGLLAATLCAGGLFTLFLRHASGSLDRNARSTRY
jgi:hypothetical protein